MPADEALTSADREEGDGQTDHSCCSVCAFGMRWECATVRGQPFVISPHHPVAGGPAYPVKCYFAQVYVQAEASGPGSFAISPGDFYMKGEDGEVWHYGDGNSSRRAGAHHLMASPSARGDRGGPPAGALRGANSRQRMSCGPRSRSG
jgi:hypothetical protein